MIGSMLRCGGVRPGRESAAPRANSLALVRACALSGIAAVSVAALVGCASGPAPTANRASGSPSASDRSTWSGVWALTDARNSTFNVRLTDGGSAVSTWSAGPTGAIGERGAWRTEAGGAMIEWTNGWVDRLQPGAHGIDHLAWGPGDAPSGAPRTHGKAVLLNDATTEFLGVWQMRGVLPGDPATVFVAIQSDGMVFKSIGEWRYGCWAPSGRGKARITWANGWYDELERDGDGYTVRTWTPTADRALAPSATNRVRRVE